jgi:crotonobetainyl-CoA:carnitine CoA-transferase CaiB-like acyl-CoA transferase
MTRPLEGTRVLDLSRVLAGPLVTQMLGDLGAEVIKIEKPGEGDDSRTYGPPFLATADGRRTRESGFYLSANRNKRSVTIDLATEAGQDLARRIARQSDVVVENFRVGSPRQVRSRLCLAVGAESPAGLPVDHRIRSDRPHGPAPRV